MLKGKKKEQGGQEVTELASQPWRWRLPFLFQIKTGFYPSSLWAFICATKPCQNPVAFGTCVREASRSGEAWDLAAQDQAFVKLQGSVTHTSQDAEDRICNQ